MKWSVGSVDISRVVEIEQLEFPSEFVVGGLEPEKVLALDWMAPFRSDKGGIRMSFHSFLVRTGGKTILIDTCFGEGRKLPSPLFSDLDRTFIDNLAAEGVRPEDVDIVLCTHMHFDHVGWNVQQEDGKWVPTFANARYLYSAKDFEIMKGRADAGDDHAFYFADSILPPVEAGLVDFIDPASGYRLSDEVSLMATPGHSVGHTSVRIESEGESAVITGDILHSPVQCAFPDYKPEADEDPTTAVQTRRAFLQSVADKPVLVLGTHFPAPTAGHVESSGDVWRFTPLSPEND